MFKGLRTCLDIDGMNRNDAIKVIRPGGHMIVTTPCLAEPEDMC